MRSTAILALGAVALPGAAGAATVNVTIPKLNVAEYHKPYVAVWLEPATSGPARTLAIWYDVRNQGGEPGTRWLSDLRAWWRKRGRSMAMPTSGISGATRAPGTHAGWDSSCSQATVWASSAGRISWAPANSS